MTAPARAAIARALHVRLALLTVAAALLVGGTRGGAQDAPPPEYAVKAAYLYNFARYVEWPPAALARNGDRLVVCVLGDDPFGPLLDRTLANKQLNGHRLEARRCDTVADATRCNVLFVAAGEDDRLAATFRAAETQSILTVGEEEGFAGRGGMVQLVREGTKVRFAINLGAVERAGLKMSYELLKLATDVIR